MIKFTPSTTLLLGDDFTGQIHNAKRVGNSLKDMLNTNSGNSRYQGKRRYKYQSGQGRKRHYQGDRNSGQSRYDNDRRDYDNRDYHTDRDKDKSYKKTKQPFHGRKASRGGKHWR